MKMKSISLVMVGILAASALAGCGNQSQASEGKGSETTETKKAEFPEKTDRIRS